MKTRDFEFDGQPLTYRTGTVRDRHIRRAALRKLFAAAGGDANVDDLTADMMLEYTLYLTNITPFKSDWWRDPSDTGESLYEGFKLFSDAPAVVYDLFRDNVLAVS